MAVKLFVAVAYHQGAEPQKDNSSEAWRQGDAVESLSRGDAGEKC